MLCGKLEQMIQNRQEKKKDLLHQPHRVDSMFAAGCEKSRTEAGLTLSLVCEWMNL
jgi:RNA-binding protein YlmH